MTEKLILAGKTLFSVSVEFTFSDQLMVLAKDEDEVEEVLRKHAHSIMSDIGFFEPDIHYVAAKTEKPLSGWENTEPYSDDWAYKNNLTCAEITEILKKETIAAVVRQQKIDNLLALESGKSAVTGESTQCSIWSSR